MNNMPIIQLFFSILLFFSVPALASRGVEEGELKSHALPPVSSGFTQGVEENQELPPHPGNNPKSAAIYGKDNRVEMPALFPWTAVGKLLLSGQPHCTATMVSECHALTAAHCVSNKKSDIQSGLSFKGAGIESEANVDATDLGGHDFEKKWANDWAVVRLDKNIGSNTGWLGFGDRKGNDLMNRELTIAGYSIDRAGATMDKQVSVLKTDQVLIFGNQDIVYFRANTFEGSSGAAIIDFDEKGLPWIVGVNTRGKSNVVFGSIQIQVVLPADTTAKDKLASGVASNQFFSQVKKFMKENPCH